MNDSMMTDEAKSQQTFGGKSDVPGGRIIDDGGRLSYLECRRIQKCLACDISCVVLPLPLTASFRPSTAG